jgi:protein involved in polysaccharide export with SLBB domain
VHTSLERFSSLLHDEAAHHNHAQFTVSEAKRVCTRQHLAMTTLSTLQDLRPEDYTYQLSPADVAEIISGTDHILAQGVKDEEDIKKVGD